MDYTKLGAGIDVARRKPTNRAETTRVASMLAGLLVMGSIWAEFSFAPLPARADSEASSEAGTEADFYPRRRRGYRNWQRQQSNQQNLATKQELAREARERKQQQMNQQQQLARGPQIKEYHFNRNRQQQGSQGSQGSQGLPQQANHQP